MTHLRQYDLRQWGLSSKDRGPGNARALASIFADTGSRTFVIPAGTFRVACGYAYEAASALSITGMGAKISILELNPGCYFDKSFMRWQSKSGVAVSRWTLNLNHPRYKERQSILEFLAYTADTDKLTIEKMAIINGSTLSLQITVGAWAGYKYSNVNINNNYLQMTPDKSQNQCIAFTTVNGLGYIPKLVVNKNVCIGSGIQVDGEGASISDNDVSKFMFGTGIFIAYNTPKLVRQAHWINGVVTLYLEGNDRSFAIGQKISVQNVRPAEYNGTFSVLDVAPGSVSYALNSNPGFFTAGGLAVSYPSSANCVISGNVIHDTGQSIDVNTSPPGGMENNCVDSVVKNNVARNLGGSGYHNFASGVKYINNVAIDVGYVGSGSAAGEGDSAAFLIFDNDTGNRFYQSTNLYLKDNIVRYKDRNRTRYGYFEEPHHEFNSRFQNNSFSGSRKDAVIRSRSSAAP